MNARERRRLERIAYHEAGHAVTAYLLGLPVGPASIVPDGEHGTPSHAARAVPAADRPRELPSPAEQRRLELEIIATLSGAIAEPNANGPVSPAATRADEQRARRLAARVNVHPGEDDPHLRWLRRRAEILRTRNSYHPALQAVVAALLERRELGAEEVTKIAREAVRAEIRR